MLKIIIGILGGILGGMGMGGGTLTIPLLTLVLQFSQIEAQGTNLIAFIPMSVIALIIHAKHHLVEFKTGLKLTIFGSVFCVLGAILANHLSNKILKKIFSIFLILLAIWQLVETIHSFIKKKHKNKSK